MCTSAESLRVNPLALTALSISSVRRKTNAENKRTRLLHGHTKSHWTEHTCISCCAVAVHRNVPFPSLCTSRYGQTIRSPYDHIHHQLALIKHQLSSHLLQKRYRFRPSDY